MNDAAVYQNTAKISIDNTLVTQHLELVRKIAYHISNRLPRTIQICDLIQSGMIGLIEASNKFDPKKGVGFESFAGIRIRGAILDDVRRNDWVPRSVYQNARKISAAIQTIEGVNGREATAKEIALKMEVSLDEYYSMVKDSGCCDVFSLDDINYEPGDENKKTDDPFEKIQDIDLKNTIANEIKKLPEREKLILSLHVNDEINFKDIAKIFDISESRVCQIHGQAISRLRARIKTLLLGNQ